VERLCAPTRSNVRQERCPDSQLLTSARSRRDCWKSRPQTPNVSDRTPESIAAPGRYRLIVGSHAHGSMKGFSSGHEHHRRCPPSRGLHHHRLSRIQCVGASTASCASVETDVRQFAVTIADARGRQARSLTRRWRALHTARIGFSNSPAKVVAPRALANRSGATIALHSSRLAAVVPPQTSADRIRPR